MPLKLILPAADARARLLAVALTWAGALFTGFNVVALLPSLRRSGTDFVLWYAVGLIARGRGMAATYDLELQRQVASRLAGFVYGNPYVSLPPMTWLALPFTYLPPTPALALWLAGLLTALVGAWYLAAPGQGWERWAWLSAGLGLFPVAFGLLIGAVSALGALLVVVAWRLLWSDRQLAAGLVLSLLLIKPQLGFLVPLSLLVAGYRRAFAGWVAGSCLLLAASALSLGPAGLRAAIATLQYAATWDHGFTTAAYVSGHWLTAVQALLAAVALFAAWRSREGGPELPIAAGLLGSLLVTPHLSLQDFTMLLPAAWLTWRAGAPTWLKGLIVAGWVIVEMALAWGAGPILLLELVWLGALVILPPRPHRATEGANPPPSGDRGVYPVRP